MFRVVKSLIKVPVVSLLLGCLILFSILLQGCDASDNNSDNNGENQVDIAKQAMEELNRQLTMNYQSEQNGMDETASDIRRVSNKELWTIVKEEIEKSGVCWKESYIAELNRKPGPYEKSGEKEERLKAAYKKACTCFELRLMNDFLANTAFSLEMPASIEYNPNKEELSFSIRTTGNSNYVWLVPSVSGKSSVFGIIPGHTYPTLAINAEPLLEHIYVGERTKKHFIKKNIIRIPMDLKTAKDMDIANAQGIMEATFKLQQIEVKTIQYDYFLPIPCLTMLSARFIVESDTLWSCGNDGVVKRSFTTTGSQRLVGQTPEITIRYSLEL